MKKLTVSLGFASLGIIDVKGIKEEGIVNIQWITEVGIKEEMTEAEGIPEIIKNQITEFK